MQINTNKLKVQPVNFMERYSFIIKKPSNYHSYIQLAQLYIEIEKLYVKKMITKRSPLLVKRNGLLFNRDSVVTTAPSA